MQWTKQYRKAITFSYDDGNAQDLRLLDLFQKYGIKATFHVNTGLNAENGSWVYRDTLRVVRLNLPEAAEAYQGQEVAVHGKLHRNLSTLSPEEIDTELREDRDAITRIFKKTPVGLSYAYGVYTPEVLAKAQELGLQYGRGTQSTHRFDPPENLLEFMPTCHHDDPMLFELADTFLNAEPETPQIFSIWGHSYELEGKHHWGQMEQFLKKISGKPDIFYGTCQEVLL